MSSRRVVSPLEHQPPRRRRRFESPGLQNDTNRALVMEERNPAIDLPSVSSSSPLPTSYQAWLEEHALSQSSPGEHELSSSRRAHDAGPMIPLDAILSSECLPFDQHAPVTDRFMNFGNDSDDSEDIFGWRDNTSALDTFITPRAITPGATTGASNPGVGTRRASIRGLSSRGRAAFGVLQEWNREQGHRNITAHPRVTAPPILLLYQTGVPGSDSSQQDQHSVPRSSSTRYLPLVIAPGSSRRSSSFSGTPMYTIEYSHRDFIDQQRTGPPRARWIPDEMPVELFESITQYLSRDDIKAMRLVSREFERGVSRALFDTVVVPFNTEIYDMIEQDRTVKRDLKGKGRADDINSNFLSLAPGSLQWQNAMDDKEDKVYKGHGLRVFEGFGSHIRRFGMSFEVKEDALINPPRKKALEQMNSYFGSYDWPSAEYTRFEKLAGLERTADETSQMKLAFSHLEKVRHLALCLDSGLGWLSGPDKSMRSQILQHDPPVFGGCSHGLVSAQRQERERLWRAFEKSFKDADVLDELKEGCLMRVRLRTALHSLPGLHGTSFADTGSWPTIDSSVIADAMPDEASISVNDSSASPVAGVLLLYPDEPERMEPPGTPRRNMPDYFRHSPPPLSPTDQRSAYDRLRDIRSAASRPSAEKSVPARPGSGHKKLTFSPAHLNQDQREWLLEAEWAQRAFLMSYMLAIVDNKAAFGKTKTLNLARISSHLVPLFYRHDFWEALPNLEDVSLGIIPDWRSVERDEAGFIETKDVEPSKATEGAYQLLNDYIGLRPNIKKIKFGWAAGGEYAEGCIGRNNHVLPAPITTLSRTVKDIAQDTSILQLPFVQHLTLSNCWISPVAIIDLVKIHEKQCLRKVTFDSVSLTAHPRAAPTNGGNNHLLPAIAAGANPLAMLGFAMHNNGPLPTPPAAQQFANQFWQGPGAGQPHGLWAQGMLQQMQIMMVQNGIQHHQLPLMWSNHPAGMTLGQITHTLTMLANGGVGAPGMFVGQAGAGGAGNAPGVVPNMMLPLPAPPAQALPQAAHQWYDGHREGSWIDVIDTLSPGPRLGMYRPRTEFEAPYPKRSTLLHSIEFKSCGYIRIQSSPFDQNVIDGPAGNRWDGTYFQRRHIALSGSMLSSADKYLGHIVQYMPERELDAMTFAWGMRTGWDDRDKAREATYDDQLPGGTGRFSGVITKDTPVGDAAMPSA